MPTAPKTRPRKATPPPPPEEFAQAPENPDHFQEPEKRHRTPKLQKLESAVAGLYIMSGGLLSTLPEQVAGTNIKIIGLNVAKSSDEIAEAWLDLAEDDRRVLKALESLTSFSGWGKVIGVHLMAVGGAMPGVSAMMAPQTPQPSAPQGNGATTVDPQTAMYMAELFKQAQSQQRAESPTFDEQPPAPQQQRQQQAPPRPAGPVTRPGRNAGIPSAADLGVTIPDMPADFPSAGSENIRG